VKTRKAILLDRKRATKAWVEYVKVVQLALNTAFRELLGTTPFEVMFGRQARTAMAAALQRNDGEGGWKGGPTDVENIQRHCTNLVESMQQLHRRVSSAHQKQRRRGRQLEGSGKSPNFAVGYFVLRAEWGKRAQRRSERRRGADRIALQLPL
jgi:hypothetical protein